jgi:hypothetical protein
MQVDDTGNFHVRGSVWERNGSIISHTFSQPVIHLLFFIDDLSRLPVTWENWENIREPVSCGFIYHKVIKSYLCASWRIIKYIWKIQEIILLPTSFKIRILCLSLDSTNHLPCKDMLIIVVLQLLIESVYEQLFQTVILEAFKTK